MAEDLATNITHIVRWYDIEIVLQEFCCKIFIEMFPGRVLTDLAAEAVPEIRSIAAAAISLDSIRQLLAKS